MLRVRMILASWGSIAVTLTKPASQIMNDQGILFAIRSLVENLLSGMVLFQNRLCRTTSESEVIVSIRPVSNLMPY
jgi:hypothetical protein